MSIGLSFSHDYFMKLKQQERLTKKEDRETQVSELTGQTLEVETEKIEIVESTHLNAGELRFLKHFTASSKIIHYTYNGDSYVVCRCSDRN